MEKEKINGARVPGAAHALLIAQMAELIYRIAGSLESRSTSQPRAGGAIPLGAGEVTNHRRNVGRIRIRARLHERGVRDLDIVLIDGSRERIEG